MDLRTRTSLFCGALAIAIAVSMLLRRRPRGPQLWFAAFAMNTGLWYLAQWLYLFVRADVWARSTAILAVFLPQFALRLFEALMPEKERRATLPRVAAILLAPVALLTVFGPLERWWVRWIVFVYVFGLLIAGLSSLWARSRSSRSRDTQRRVRFMVLVGALAVTASLADFLWFIDVKLPPIGAAFSILFLFVISESLIRQRFVDIYDVLGQVMLSAALASCLAAIFYVFVGLFGGFDTMYLAAFLATIVILVVFEPLREKVTLAIHRMVFRERADLERAVVKLRGQLLHVLDAGELGSIIMSALENSRLATAGALYVRDPLDAHFRVLADFGPAAPDRIETAKLQPILVKLETQTTIVLDEVTRQIDEARRNDQPPRAEGEGGVLSAAEVLGPFRRGIILGVRTRTLGLTGLLLLADDRANDAFSPDEIHLLQELALQVGVVLENSRLLRQMQVRDRLMVLGQMAAGLAHEVRNPLGAIKGAAQLLEGHGSGAIVEADREFVSIILEEVDRLDRVVSSVLDYARPAPGTVREFDLKDMLERTAKILAAEEISVSVDPEILSLRADAEQLRQVLINLVRNAVQAMGGKGNVRILANRTVRSEQGGETAWVEIRVQDEGPGIAEEVMKNLFVPFVTTKERGTGLGLAISQRIVEELGGRIFVSSRRGEGSTFTVVLPLTPVEVERAAKAGGPSSARRTPSEPPGKGAARGTSVGFG
jgi:two-component system, NtrC family, sensor histidine kinase HydH